MCLIQFLTHLMNDCYLAPIEQFFSCINFMVFGLTQQALKPTICCTRDEHANCYTTNVVLTHLGLVHYQQHMNMHGNYYHGFRSLPPNVNTLQNHSTYMYFLLRIQLEEWKTQKSEEFFSGFGINVLYDTFYRTWQNYFSNLLSTCIKSL